MSFQDRWIKFIVKIATCSRGVKIIVTPIGAIIWFSVSLLLIYISIQLDRVLNFPGFISIPYNIFIGLLSVGFGFFIGLWTIILFMKAKGTPVPLNPPQKLITTGPYALVRNPMLIGWFGILFGIGFFINSISLTFIFTPAFLVLNIIYLKKIEEKELEKRFGEEYLRYKKEIPMFIPKIKS